MTHIQKAYDALIEKLEEKLSQSYRDNDVLMHENTLREEIMTKFVYENMGSDALLSLANLIDEHEKKQRNDPKYNYGFVEMVETDYPYKKGQLIKTSQQVRKQNEC